MDKRKIESLRDLAIAHFPAAQKKRSDAIRWRGNRFADSGLQDAYLFRKAEWTAVEKQARDLLELTFNHPDALAEYPYNLDAVEDAEHIASDARGLEAAIELQPKIEAAMLDAARLLCELTGAALPPWVNPAPDTKAGAVKPASDGTAPLKTIFHSTKTRRDSLTPVIELAQKQCKNQNDTAEVWAALLVLAEKKTGLLIGATEDGLQYLKDGTAANFNREALRKRLTR